MFFYRGSSDRIVTMTTTDPIIIPRKKRLGSWIIFGLLAVLNIGTPLAAFTILPARFAVDFLMGYAIAGGALRCYDMWRER